MLNKEQAAAAYSRENKIIVLSSVATGKTTTLTERVRFLLKEGVNPDTIVAITFTNAAAEEMRIRLGEDYKPGLTISTIHSYANQLLSRFGIQTSHLIEEEEFDEFFELIKENPDCILPVEHLLLDEAQDTGEAQFEFLLDMVKPKNYFLIGDLRQCQPAGTKIQLRNDITKNIEDVQIGDSVVWYSASKGYVSALGAKAHNAIEAKVTDIQEREIIGDHLVQITTNQGLSSTYTPNHRTFVRLEKGTHNEVVYLMCDENERFRVGTSTLVSIRGQGNTNPWKAKMRDEGCEKIWILKAFQTKKEALLWEDKISYLYQIPQTCWQIDKIDKTQEDIDFIYEGLDTKKGAIKCLKFFNKDIKYPFYTKGETTRYALNAASEIYVCNIIPEMMSCVVYNPKLKHRKEYQKISSIDFIWCEEPTKVYSLKIEPYETYVADGIITHNSIYSFNGARPDILERLMNSWDVTIYELNQNYRNDRKILQYAKQIIAKTGRSDNSIPMRIDNGVVIEKLFNVRYLVDMIKGNGEYKDWFILTRSNEQLYSIKYDLEQRGIPCSTFKRKDLSFQELSEMMAEDTVKVLTIHTAKGLEAKNVAVIGALSYNAEELRVAYVAATRAQEMLIWMLQPKRPQMRKF